MSVLRSNLSNLMKVDLDGVFFEAWKNQPYQLILNTIFDVITSDKKEEKFQTVAGFGIAPVKAEGADLAEKTFREAYQTTLTHKTLGYYFGVSMEAKQDEQYGVIPRAPKACAKSMDYTINYYMSKIFGYATSSTAGANGLDFSSSVDGSALLATSHALAESGGTCGNKPSTDADLSATTIWAGVDKFYEFLDDAGKPIVVSPRYLLVPHQTQKVARELLESELFPESAKQFGPTVAFA